MVEATETPLPSPAFGPGPPSDGLCRGSGPGYLICYSQNLACIIKISSFGDVGCERKRERERKTEKRPTCSPLGPTGGGAAQIQTQGDYTVRPPSRRRPLVGGTSLPSIGGTSGALVQTCQSHQYGF